MQKILILGVSGMLGHTIFRFLSSQQDLLVTGTVRHITQEIKLVSSKNIVLMRDVFNKEKLENIINSNDVIINCIGAIKQKYDNKNTDYILLNSYFPHLLNEICIESNKRLIHFSTDCIFNGEKGNYDDGSLSNVIDMYGKSKYLGEVYGDKTLTLRTSLIGHELKSSYSLIDWFLNSNSTVNGYTKAIFSGLPTIEIAHFLYEHVLQSQLHGIYNLSAAPISKFDLLTLVNEVYKLNKTIVPKSDFVIDRSLDSHRLRSLTKYTPPDWNTLVVKMYLDYLSLGALLNER
ncbi:dTDP-4-dehydrorhamnose reductase family protein [Escherichia coli]|uniref:dTDP-4-dehydrorhamnose reductase family protein n=1 Tax=Escherichia coli TaxID=562 RepID=UPI000DDDDB88|nr:SDR family oxidoreductase [Escherichia coli]